MKKLILIFSVVLMSCTALGAKGGKTENEKPAWLTNPESVYSPNKYLVAIGEGDTRTAAENNALGNLTRIFESTVSAEQTVLENYYEMTNDDKTTTKNETAINQNVNVKSGQTLFNVQFSESYTDKKGRVHAIAYLDKQKTGQLYEERIENNAEKVVSYAKKAQEESNLPKKYSYLDAARTLVIGNQMLIAQLEIISPQFKDMLELNYVPEEIQEAWRNTAKSITCEVNFTGNDELAEFLQGFLSDYGFSVVKEETPVLLIVGNIALEELDERNNVQYLRWKLDLSAIDSSGAKIITLSKSNREGGLSYERAKAVAVTQIKKAINKEFKQKLNDYFKQYEK